MNSIVNNSMLISRAKVSTVDPTDVTAPDLFDITRLVPDQPLHANGQKLIKFIWLPGIDIINITATSETVT